MAFMICPKKILLLIFLDDLRVLAELGDKQSQIDYEAVRKWAGYSPKKAKAYKGSKWEKEFQGYAKEIEERAIYSHYNTLYRMGGKYLLEDGRDKFIICYLLPLYRILLYNVHIPIGEGVKKCY